MRDGIYTVDSIEKGLVKVLFRPNEDIEELIPVSSFPFTVKEGDIIEVKRINENIEIVALGKTTENTRAYVKSLKEKLLKKNMK